MKRFYLTPFALAIMLGVIFALPRRGAVAATSLSHQAIDIENKIPPLDLGNWTAKVAQASAKEINILNHDTTFIKGNYSTYDMPPFCNARGQRYEQAINLSIVVSGFDINNSIHRPERCLRAQGHLNLVSLPTTISTAAGRSIKVQRLTSMYPIPPEQEGGETFPIGFISYYYFVGHKHLTHDHWRRTWLDMKDRLFLGTDQQWSFVMLSMPYNLGKDAAETNLNLQIADKKIRQLLGELTDQIVNWEEISAP